MQHIATPASVDLAAAAELPPARLAGLGQRALLVRETLVRMVAAEAVDRVVPQAALPVGPVPHRASLEAQSHGLAAVAGRLLTLDLADLAAAEILARRVPQQALRERRTRAPVAVGRVR